jgi:hypothetical protein
MPRQYEIPSRNFPQSKANASWACTCYAQNIKISPFDFIHAQSKRNSTNSAYCYKRSIADMVYQKCSAQCKYTAGNQPGTPPRSEVDPLPPVLNDIDKRVRRAPLAPTDRNPSALVFAFSVSKGRSVPQCSPTSLRPPEPEVRDVRKDLVQPLPISPIIRSFRHYHSG